MTLIPDWVAAGGTIGARQTTYWTLRSIDGARSARVHFIRKAEFRYAGPSFKCGSVVAEHPVLRDHTEPEDALYISSGIDKSDKMIDRLEAACSVHFDEWRDIKSYLNPDYPAAALLTEGHGMLMRAPRSFIRISAKMLVLGGVRVDSPSLGPDIAVRPSALILGASFVVAEQFRFEPLREESAEGH